MEGYSVTEAASILGVPSERIWELLARGVLAGAPEGETGMRVFLQPRPAPAPPEPRGPNGHSTDADREMSPFRELLTEFRNLTERYGQALLALGESRGEVAALRSRVDLLEARMDLGLPGPTSWAPSPAFPVEHAVIPTAPEPAAAPADAVPDAAPVDEVAEDDEPRQRARGPRRATESFAEALARAEDPSPPELPESLEARTRELDEAVLPREVPAAEAMPVADEADIADLADLADDADLADEAPPAVEAEPEPVAVEVEQRWVGAAAVTEEPSGVAELIAEPEPAERDEREAWADEEFAQPAEPVLADASEPIEETAAYREPEPIQESETVEAPEPPQAAAEPIEAESTAHEEPAPLGWDAERYTTTIDEPDWFAAEVDEAPAVGSEPQPEAEPQADAEPQPEAEPQPVIGEALETSGAEEMESAPASEPPPAMPAEPVVPAPLPGSAELDRALDALRRQAIAASDDGDEWPPAQPSAEPASDPPSTFRLPTQQRAGTPPVTPAGRAYRRLRRIFPG
jgi:hypothetical protein